METKVKVQEVITAMAESSVDPLELMETMKDCVDGEKLLDGSGLDDIDRLRVTTVTAEIAKKLQDVYKSGAKEEYVRQYGNVTGDKLHHNGRVRLYDTYSYTWENVHNDDPELQTRNELYRQVQKDEEELKIKKMKLKGYDEALAVRYPNSGAIHKKTIVSIL